MLPPPPRSTLFPYTTLFRSSLVCWAAAAPVTRLMPAIAMVTRVEGVTPVAVAGTHTARRRETRSEEHTSELQSHSDLVCRLLLEKKKMQHLTTDRERSERFA